MTKVEELKMKVSDQLIKGQSRGIAGVGIDPTGGKCDGGSLIVFYSEEKAGEPWLKKFLGDTDFNCVDGRSAELPPTSPLEGKIKRSLAKSSPPLTLAVGSQICCGKEAGRLGCFVTLVDKSVHALTVGHLFDSSKKQPGDVFYYDGASCSGTVVGKKVTISPIGNSSTADCAMFDPYMVSLQKNPNVVQDLVSSSDIANIVGKKLWSLGSGAKGLVLDTDFAIKYPIPGVGEVLFTGQVFVKNICSICPFGLDGYSGSLIVLDEAVATYARGVVVGLYAWGDANDYYHAVTPLYSCASNLGVQMMIYNQDSSSFAARLRRKWLKLREGAVRMFRRDHETPRR